jgi:hypothetical protein
MIRTACLFAVLLVPAGAFAGSIDSVNVSTENSAGTDYIKVSGTYTSNAAMKIIQVDLVCTTDATKTENGLAVQIVSGTEYKRLSNNAASANTFRVTVTLFENGVNVGSKTVTVTVKMVEGAWVVSTSE